MRIPFAVGSLAMLGRRVAPALRVMWFALAIIDDIGAILVFDVLRTECGRSARRGVGGLFTKAVQGRVLSLLDRR
jgi:Na+/H+ antiporter NhaA